MPHTPYKVAGEIWPSATELTHLLPQDWLWAWYKREVKAHGYRGWQKCNATSNRGKRLGTHVHGLVEQALTGKPYTCYMDSDNQILEPKRRLKQLEAWAKAIVETTQKDTFEEIEIKVVSETNHLHGTCDAIVMDDLLGLKVVDWKTSGGMDIGFPVQLAIYARCWNEQHPDQPINTGEIQRVDKKSTSKKALAGDYPVQVKTYDRLDRYYIVIDALRIIWDYVNKQGRLEETKC